MALPNGLVQYAIHKDGNKYIRHTTLKDKQGSY